MASEIIEATMSGLVPTVSSAEDTPLPPDFDLNAESNERARLWTESSKVLKRLQQGYEANITSYHAAYDQLKWELAVGNNVLQQERNEKIKMTERLQMFKIRLTSELVQKEGSVEGEARCEAHLKKYKAEVASSRQDCDKFKSELANAQILLATFAENLQTCKVLLKSERTPKADPAEGEARCEAHVKKYKAEVASSRQACEQLESQLATAQTSLEKERDEKTNSAENLRTFKALLKSERTRNEDLVEGKSRCEAHLKKCKAEVASSHRACEQLERQLVTAKTSLGQERGEKNTLAESLGKFKILLKSEQAQKAEMEKSKTRCEALLEEQTSRRLLGTGINVQGAYQTLPEIEASIRQTLTTTVSEWVEQESHGLLDFSKNWKWFIPEILAHLFTLCKQLVDGLRQQYVNMFLGKVEGALEDDMDPETGHFMRNHLRCHHLTLFPAMSVGTNREKTCGLITTRLGAIIADYVDGGICHDMVNHALAVSGIEEITGQYLTILASCAVQHPAVSFSCDCYRVQPFDKRLHFEPIDGDGDVATGGQCMVIFPALITKQGESLANKRFVLGPQEQG